MSGVSLAPLAIFDELLDVSEAARDALLAKLTVGRPEVRAQVLRLMAADQAGDPLFDGVGHVLVADLLVREIGVGLPATPVDDEDLPVFIDGYRVLARLGAGSSGVVYEAEQSSPRRRVAIKTVHRSRSSESARRQFLDEAHALSTLSHPSVPYVIEAGEWKGGVYIAMELVRGLSLADATQRMERRTIVELFRSLSVGVHHVHQGGWVHRDLKPANVCLTVDGTPKLLDFGMALSLGGRGGLGGTVNYMSPEQAAGAAGDVTADVYALGAMLYEALVGSVPIDCGGASFVDAARLKRGPIDLQPLSPQLRVVLARSLRVDPHERYASAMELADDLGRVLHDLPVYGGATSNRLRAQLLMRRNRVTVRRVMLLAALLSLIALLVAGWQYSAASTRERNAMASLHTLQDATSALLADGQGAHAREVFRTWVKLPENVGTRSISEAWLRHEGLLESVQPGQGRMAIANALATAPDRASRTRALKVLVAHFRDAGEWRPLERALIALERTGAQGERSDWLAALAGQRRLTEAALYAGDDSVAPLLRALSVSTSSSMAASSVGRAPDGHLWVRSAREGQLHLTHERAPFRVIETFSQEQLGGVPSGFAWNGGYMLVSGDYGGTTDRALIEWDPRTMELRTIAEHLPEPAREVELADVDGDGLDELYVGTGAYSRSVYRLRPDEAEFTNAIAPDQRQHSDIESVAAVDLDGDGTVELAVSHGSWESYKVRIYGAGEGGLTLLHELNHQGALVAIPHPDGGHSLGVFRGPSGSKQLYPAGLYLFRMIEGVVEQTAFVPAPMHLASDFHAERVVSGDFDGDGLTDILWLRAMSTKKDTWALRQVSPGVFEGVVIDDLIPRLAIQADDDPAHEVIVASSEAGLRVLGAGDEPIPAVPRLPRSLPDLGGAFGLVQDLADVGLEDQASQRLASLARLASDTEVESALWAASAELERAAGRVEVALSRVDTAIALSNVDAERLHGRAAAWSMEVYDYDSALRHLRAQRAPDSDMLARAEREASMVVDVRLTSPDPAWDVLVPAALHARPTGLVFDAYGYERALLLRDFEVGGAVTGMSFEVELSRLEPGVALNIGFRRPELGEENLTFRVVSWGGDSRQTHQVDCVGFGLNHAGFSVGPTPVGPAPAVISVRVFQDEKRRFCSISVDGELRMSRSFTHSKGAPLDAVAWGVWLFPDATVDNAAARGVLRNVRLWGVKPSSQPIDGRRRAAAAWVAGDRAGAIAMLADQPVDWRNAELLLSGGEEQRVAAWLRQLTPTEYPRLAAAMRRDPSRWVSAAKSAWGPEFSPAYASVWRDSVPISAADPEWLRVDRGELEAFAVTSADEAATVYRYASTLQVAGRFDAALVQARRCANSGVEHFVVGNCWGMIALHHAERGEPDKVVAACERVAALAAGHVERLHRRNPRIASVCGI